MPLIRINTIIHAHLEIVFNVSRSIDLHTISMQRTHEKATGGIITGLIQEGETVTWQARHLLKTRTLKTIITKMQLYTFFEDTMQEGDFKKMRHQHHFISITQGTEMKDEFLFESPYGLAGKIVNVLFLKHYMKRLLEKRNAIIKDYAESGKWKSLPGI